VAAGATRISTELTPQLAQGVAGMADDEPEAQAPAPQARGRVLASRAG
jgi:hypothetical protein